MNRLFVAFLTLLITLAGLPPPVAAAERLALATPLLVDGGRRRIYGLLRSEAGTPRRIVVHSTRDGRPITAFQPAGPFALDVKGKRLFLDLGEDGLAVMDANTGAILRTFEAPPDAAGLPATTSVWPQFDPATGQILIFRGPTAFALDADTGAIEQIIDFDLRPQDNCRSPHDVRLPIDRSFFSPDARLLYASFVTYSCVPWIGHTVVAYDLASEKEVGRQGTEPFAGMAAGDGFFAESWMRFGIGTIWTLREGKPAHRSSGWSAGGPFALDTKRGLLYQSGDGAVRSFRSTDMSLSATVRQPAPGTLAAYDAVSDNVFFVDGQSVRAWAAAKLGNGVAAAPKVAKPAAQPVALIAPSPNWSQDRTLFGVWSTAPDETQCYVFSQTGGPLLKSGDGGKQWLRGLAGLGGDCALISAVAVSPALRVDRTLLAGVKGNGVFKSTDAGASWQPAGKGLPHMGVTAVFMSPGFATDRTAFASVLDNPLQRTVDGGASWHGLKTVAAPLIALSHEFDRDGTLVVYGTRNGAGVLQFSTDRGETWRETTSLPSQAGLRMLSLAPAFARWHVAMAGDDNGTIYRSTDSGLSWQSVLQTGEPSLGFAGLERMQIVYGPNEARREVFLLVSGTRYEDEKRSAWGRLYRSVDGGQSWDRLNAGVPTALAISPDFAVDGLIFTGTADGRVLSLRGLELPTK